MPANFIPQIDPYSVPQGFKQGSTKQGGSALYDPQGNMYIRNASGFQLITDPNLIGSPSSPMPTRDILAPNSSQSLAAGNAVIAPTPPPISTPTTSAPADTSVASQPGTAMRIGAGGEIFYPDPGGWKSSTTGQIIPQENMNILSSQGRASSYSPQSQINDMKAKADQIKAALDSRLNTGGTPNIMTDPVTKNQYTMVNGTMTRYTGGTAKTGNEVSSSDAISAYNQANIPPTPPDLTAGLIPPNSSPETTSALGGLISTITSQINQFMQGQSQAVSLTKQYTDLINQKDASGMSVIDYQNTISGLKAAEIGNPAEVAMEISGRGFATAGQIAAISNVRNAALDAQIQKYTGLMDVRSNYINQYMSLTGQDRAAATAAAEKVISLEDTLARITGTLDQNKFNDFIKYQTLVDRTQNNARLEIQTMYQEGVSPSQSQWTQAGFSGSPSPAKTWSMPYTDSTGTTVQVNQQTGEVRKIDSPKSSKGNQYFTNSEMLKIAASGTPEQTAITWEGELRSGNTPASIRANIVSQGIDPTSFDKFMTMFDPTYTAPTDNSGSNWGSIGDFFTGLMGNSGSTTSTTP